VADVAGDNEFLFALKCSKRDNPVFSVGAEMKCWIDGDASKDPRVTTFYAIVRTYGAWDLQNGCTPSADRSESWHKNSFNHRCNDPGILGNEPPEIVEHARDMWRKYALFLNSCGKPPPGTHTIYGWNSASSDAPQWHKWLLFYAEFELATNYKHIDAMHLVGNQYCVGNSRAIGDCIRRTNTGVTKYECSGADSEYSPLQATACALLKKNCAHSSPLYDAYVTFFNLQLRLPGARREVTRTDVRTWGPPSATGMTPYQLGIAPSQQGTAPSQMGTAPSQLGSCPRQLEMLYRSQESLQVLGIPITRPTDQAPHNLDEYNKWLQLDGAAYDAVLGDKKAAERHSQCEGVTWGKRGWFAQVNFHCSTEIPITVPNQDGSFGVTTTLRRVYFTENSHSNLKRVKAEWRSLFPAGTAAGKGARAISAIRHRLCPCRGALGHPPPPPPRPKRLRQGIRVDVPWAGWKLERSVGPTEGSRVCMPRCPRYCM
jgi:hypothetical protein